MPNQLIAITLTSRDRSGIVSNIAAIVHSMDGNWLDSQMARMAGLFTGIITARLPLERLEELEHKLAQLESSGIHTQVTQLLEEEAVGATHIPFSLSGPDRKGIVNELTRAFNQLNINIESMRTRTESAPWSGDSLFYANGSLLLPANTDMDVLLEKLDGVEDKTGIDVMLDMDNMNTNQGTHE